jgi:DNA-binding transcriptional MerR regulator
VRIGELGKKTGLSPKTIRYYEDIGLLADPGRTPSGYRDYGDDALERLGFIKAAQAVGFTLGEIKEILGFRTRGETPCAHVANLMEQRVRTLSAHIAGLQAMRAELKGLVQRARDLPPPRPGTFCHIIENASSSAQERKPARGPSASAKVRPLHLRPWQRPPEFSLSQKDSGFKGSTHHLHSLPRAAPLRRDWPG